MDGITGGGGVLAETALHVDREHGLARLLRSANGHLVIAPGQRGLGEVRVQPRSQSSDLRHRRRQARPWLALGTACQVTRECQVGGRWPDQGPGRRALFKVAVAE